MPDTILHIKNMVCDRCIKVVREELQKLGYDVKDVSLGTATIGSPEAPDMGEVRHVLETNGFALLEDKKVQLVNQLKTLIIKLIHEDKLEGMNINISTYLSEATGKDYHYLSQLFSSVGDTTIEKYIIKQKVERVKELLVYDELSISEISWRMGYSSTAHLSNQFKQVTGFTPSQFRSMKAHPRKGLDEV